MNDDRLTESVSRMTPETATRCSDADREAIAGELRRHAVEGRLELAELDDRLDRALQARTRVELHATLDGLPATTPGRRPKDRLATMSATTATAAVVAVLAIALWVTGHLAEDGLMVILAAAILLVIWRRPRPRRDP